MNEATRRLSLALGMLAGLMGIEHGIGEVLEGYRPTDSMFILSWPNSAFFETMAGEPALTILLLEPGASYPQNSITCLVRYGPGHSPFA